MTNLARWVIEQLLQVLDGKVGDTDVLDLTSSRQLLQLLPCLDEIPVWEVLLQICGVGGAGPVHEVEINVVNTERLQGRVNSLLNALVPWVVELSCEPDLLAGNARVLDATSDFGLIAVRELISYQLLSFRHRIFSQTAVSM